MRVCARSRLLVVTLVLLGGVSALFGWSSRPVPGRDSRDVVGEHALVGRELLVEGTVVDQPASDVVLVRLDSGDLAVAVLLADATVRYSRGSRARVRGTLTAPGLLGSAEPIVIGPSRYRAKPVEIATRPR